MPNKRNIFVEKIYTDDLNWTDKGEDALVSDVVMNKLRDISKKYETDLDRRAKEYAESTTEETFDSDEELLAKAKESLGDKYDRKGIAAEKKKTEGLEDLEMTRANAASDRERAQSKLKTSLVNAWENKKDDLSRKGMSHSSVADLSRREALSSYHAASRELNDQYDRKVQIIDRKMDRLNAEYKEALRSYEISYAIELEKKLADLTAKRDRLVDSYERTHDSKVKKAYNSYIKEEERAQNEYELSHGDYFGEKKENYLERYDYLVGELKGKKKSAVTSFLNENASELKSYLGVYYDAFVKEVS